MKKIILFCTAVFVLFAVSACTVSLPKRISKLADKVEAKGANFSQDEWEKVGEQFEALMTEFNDNYGKFTPEERSEVYKAAAKFMKAAVKAGAGSIASGIGSFLGELEEEGGNLIESAKGFLEGLGL